MKGFLRLCLSFLAFVPETFGQNSSSSSIDALPNCAVRIAPTLVAQRLIETSS
jgi:hypothetical protein